MHHPLYCFELWSKTHIVYNIILLLEINFFSSRTLDLSKHSRITNIW